MQRGHRHVESIPPRILDGKELRLHAPGLEALQTRVTAYTVLLVDHRRAGLQVRQIVDDLFGVARPPRPAPRLGGPLADQLGLGHHLDAGAFRDQSLLQGGHGEGQTLLTLEEGVPPLHHPGPDVQVLQILQQPLPAPCRFRHQQHPLRPLGQVAGQRLPGVGGPRL